MQSLSLFNPTGLAESIPSGNHTDNGLQALLAACGCGEGSAATPTPSDFADMLQFLKDVSQTKSPFAPAGLIEGPADLSESNSGMESVPFSVDSSSHLFSMASQRSSATSPILELASLVSDLNAARANPLSGSELKQKIVAGIERLETSLSATPTPSETAPAAQEILVDPNVESNIGSSKLAEKPIDPVALSAAVLPSLPIAVVPETATVVTTNRGQLHPNSDSTGQDHSKTQTPSVPRSDNSQKSASVSEAVPASDANSGIQLSSAVPRPELNSLEAKTGGVPSSTPARAPAPAKSEQTPELKYENDGHHSDSSPQASRQTPLVNAATPRPTTLSNLLSRETAFGQASPISTAHVPDVDPQATNIVSVKSPVVQELVVQELSEFHSRVIAATRSERSPNRTPPPTVAASSIAPPVEQAAEVQSAEVLADDQQPHEAVNSQEVQRSSQVSDRTSPKGSAVQSAPANLGMPPIPTGVIPVGAAINSDFLANDNLPPQSSKVRQTSLEANASISNPMVPNDPAISGQAMIPDQVVSEPARQTIDQLIASTVHQATLVEDAGSQHFEMRLDPPELGEISIEIHRSANGEVAVRVSASHPQTHSIIHRHSAEITQALNDQGLSLSQFDLSQQQHQQTGSEEARQNQESFENSRLAKEARDNFGSVSPQRQPSTRSDPFSFRA